MVNERHLLIKHNERGPYRVFVDVQTSPVLQGHLGNLGLFVDCHLWETRCVKPGDKGIIYYSKTADGF